MPQTMYGPWQLSAKAPWIGGGGVQRFRVDGSTTTDGVYDVTSSAPVELIVDGPEWSLGLEQWIEGEGWTQPRTDTIIRQQDNGLVVVILIHSQLLGPAGRIGLPSPLRISCLAQDPLLSPPHQDWPDFGLPAS